jgi:hypothetical protein
MGNTPRNETTNHRNGRKEKKMNAGTKTTSLAALIALAAGAIRPLLAAEGPPPQGIADALAPDHVAADDLHAGDDAAVAPQVQPPVLHQRRRHQRTDCVTA